MESNRTFIYFIFGVSLLPKIYSDIFSPLILMKKPNTKYSVADQFQNVQGENSDPGFFIPEDHQLYQACPEENAPLHATYALKVQEFVPDLQAPNWELFVKGIFPHLRCDKPIKPIALKIKIGFLDIITTDAFVIGFLIHDTNANFRELWKEFEDLPLKQEYDFISFLRIKVNTSSISIISEEHQIVSGGLLEPDSALVFPQPYEKNLSFYRSDVDLLYSNENQSYVFQLIFGQSFADYYNPPNKMLCKTQLAPYGDFLLHTWKLTSFADLNTFPVWKQLHPQLRKIEIFLRKVARELVKLTIKTGTNRVLKLTDVNNKEQLLPVYLHKKKTHPVPRFVWKLARFKPLLNDDYFTQAILIVMHNDPYTPNQKSICDDVGERLGWMVSNKDYKTGLTYVCPVDWLITEKLLDQNFDKNFQIFDLKEVVKLRYVGDRTYEKITEDIYSKIMQSS